MDVIRIDDSQKKTLAPGCHVQFVHTRNMTFAHWSLEPEARVPAHAHPHEQVVNMIAGVLDLTVGEASRRLRPGEVVVIPPEVSHSARAVTACRVIDVFYPVREDYR
jgi:quercetin dioxygenase-like cupin family protein